MEEVKLYYACRRTRNFGDLLSLEISKELFGISCMYAEPQQCEAMFIGSIFEQFIYPYRTKFHKLHACVKEPPVKVWGSGFKMERHRRERSLQFFRQMEIHALRGKKTAKKLEEILQRDFSNTALGDPGLFAAELIKGEEIPKQCAVGIIPHYIDKGEETLKKIRIPEAQIIDVCADPRECIRRIAGCDVILSSSLHGIIVADTLGIPNARIILSDKIEGGDFKYEDYDSVFRESTRRTFNLIHTEITENMLESVKSDYIVRLREIEHIKEGLKVVFPYKH